MKKLYTLLLFIIMIGSVNAQDIEKITREENRKFHYGIELGLYNGVYAKYNFNPKFSVLGQLGMNYYLAYTVPRSFYTSGMAPAINLTGQWHFWRFNELDNSGMYLSLGFFYDWGKYGLFRKNLLNGRDYWTLESGGLITRWGIETPITDHINFKANIVIHTGLGLDAEWDGVSQNREISRADILFDVGVTIPLR